MPRRGPLTSEQRRLLRITGRMPLASVANLASVLETTGDRVRAMLGRLRAGGWVSSVKRGMTERRQHRYFLTSRAVDLLYATDHRHPSPREAARAGGRADIVKRFVLDHDHPVHLEDQQSSPFVAGEEAEACVDTDTDTDTESDAWADHEHPPWTATSRGLEICLRRLAMLESVYRLAPDLVRSGRVSLPAGETADTRDARLTDFRLLRHGGFYHAVARYGQDLWVPFTYAGIHATERVLRRKEQHRFWGVDCYCHQEDSHFRIGNRVFYEDPDQEVEPSAQVVVAADAWAMELARNTLSGNTPTIFCTPDGNCTPSVELRPSRDLVSDPSGHPSVGRPESVELWLRRNPDMAAIDGRLAHRLFLAVCQFPAMRSSWLCQVVQGPASEVSRHLKRFVDTGLVAVFDGRHYLSELGMRRAADMSRILPSVIRRRHGAYLDRWYREHEERHNDGVNRLVMRFAREGVAVVAGRRGEVNVPDLTQVRPDLVAQVSDGTLGPGPHCIEFERHAVSPYDVEHKLGPYRRMAAVGRPLPLLVVCETARGRANFQAYAGTLPMLTATQEEALAGPVTGAVTVWSREGVPAALHCRG
ncbi:MAG: MarR family winged helix-turn-helix transcriptional regulator [Chloroflexi bacterium]|nr:MarR family winged helix-turn-helix transcriptional regulator [Chloroflexota bacterium]